MPGCPGWRGEDVVRHTAQVYLHKAESIRTGEMPHDGWPPEHLAAMKPAEALDDCHWQLVEQLDTHDPADAAATWWPEDQTVGFWIRRMAHETSVHRHDVERAVGAGTPVDPALAVDGIDEVLVQMVGGDWSDEVIDAASGATVAVEGDGRVWAVTLERVRVLVAREEPAVCAARVSGAPREVLLWLWGRASPPTVTGDAAAARELRGRLALATR